MHGITKFSWALIGIEFYLLYTFIIISNSYATYGCCHPCFILNFFEKYEDNAAIESDRSQIKSSFAIKKYTANCIEVGIKFLFSTQLTYHACHPFFRSATTLQQRYVQTSDNPYGLYENHRTGVTKVERKKDRPQSGKAADL